MFVDVHWVEGGRPSSTTLEPCWEFQARWTNPGQEDPTENQKPRQGSILQLEEVLRRQGAESLF